jgi:hypothetical protein
MRLKVVMVIMILFEFSFGTWNRAVKPASALNPSSTLPIDNHSTAIIQQAIPSCTTPCLTVRIFPDGGLHSGDWISLQVVAPQGVDLSQQHLTIRISSGSPDSNTDQPIIAILGPADFVQDYAQSWIANLIWAWDTRNLKANLYTLDFSVTPKGLAWKQSIRLAPPTPDSPHWARAQSLCCTFDYITGTAAERDLAAIKRSADLQALSVTQLLRTPYQSSIPIILVPRVLGQGGFTSDKIYISYLDRNYSSDNFSLILHHEMVHFLDVQMGGDLRPEFFEEGLAVYLSGGHYTHEPLLFTAATLSEQGLYRPFPGLIDAFYSAQHETCYMEAAALVEWMVNTWGWNAFSSFYRDIHSDPSGSQAQAVNQALEKHFHLSLFQVEDRFMNILSQQPSNPDLESLIRLTAHYFDTVRRYQQLLDPSAYFRQVWLLNIDAMVSKGIVADYIRHPENTPNLTIELLLMNARQEMNAGNNARATQTIQAVNQALDAISGYPTADLASASLDQRFKQSLVKSPLAASMESAVEAVQSCGLDPQSIQLGAQNGQAAVITTWPQSATLSLTYQQTWSADCPNTMK